MNFKSFLGSRYVTHDTHKKLFWVSAPHIEDLVLLPTPVLRLLNVIDDSHLYNEDEYEGEFFFFSRCISVAVLKITIIL